MSTAELLRSQELRSAEALAGQASEEFERAFKALVTAERLTERIRELVGESAVPRQVDVMSAIDSMERIDVDIWSIEYAGQAAATVKDLLDLSNSRA